MSYIEDEELMQKLLQVGREADQQIQELRKKHEQDLEWLSMKHREFFDEAVEREIHFNTDTVEGIIAANERLKKEQRLILDRRIDGIRDATKQKVEEVRHIHTMNTWRCKNDGRAYKFVYLGHPCYRTHKGEIWDAVEEGQLGDWLGTWNPQTNCLEDGEEPLRPQTSRY
jgi:hypothetical protein